MKLFILVFVQNFFGTLNARARNSDSFKYNGISAFLYHLVWFFTFKEVAQNLNDPWTCPAFVAGAVLGSLVVQQFALKYVEKDKS